MASNTNPTPPPPPDAQTRSTGTGSGDWTRYLLPCAQAATLLLAVGTFIACATKLMAFIAVAPPSSPPSGPAPEWTENREDKEKFYRYQDNERQRAYLRAREAEAWSQTRAQERAAVLPACGLLLAIGIAFIAITLFIAATRAERAGFDAGTVAVGRFARWSPGIAALVCASIVAAVSAPDGKPATATPTGNLPNYNTPSSAPATGFAPAPQAW